MGMKACPVPGCERRCSDEYLMCRSDWWRVKPETREEVYSTWRAFSEATAAASPTLAGAADASSALRAYESARGVAIAEAMATRARAAEKAAR